jgi:hypothetical protein
MLLVPLVAAVGLLAGCTGLAPAASSTTAPTNNGVELRSAEEILGAATDAMARADSFRMTGTLGEGAFAAEVYLVFAGDDVQGTATILGFRVQAIKVANDLFLNADASLYAALIPEAQDGLNELSGTWVRVPLSWVSDLLPVPLTVDDVIEDLGAIAPLTKGDAGTVDGQPVITVTDADGVVYSVATVGEPYLLQVDIDGQPITFTDFNAEISIVPPAEYQDIG